MDKTREQFESWSYLPSSVKKLITGTGRCGTMYLTTVLRHAGCSNVWHERPKAPILLSWGLAPLWENKDKCLHVVREPLSCIRSLASTTTMGWLYSSYHIERRFGVDLHEENMLYRCMYRYHAWNLMCEDISCHTFQLENVDQHVGILAEFCEGDQDRILKSIDETKTVNQRRKHLPKLTWDDLFEKDEELTQKIQEQTKRYGYAV